METIWLDKVDSTNSEILRRMSELASLSVVAARAQTAGRGRRGNVWSSAEAQNLTFSILVRPGVDGLPAIPAREQFVITEIVTLSIVDYLHSSGIEARIKWPNDIYCGDLKICGILIENTVRDDLLVSSIIGVGLNVNQTDFPAEIPNPVSMSLLTGRKYVIEDELERILGCFEKRLHLCAKTLLDDYLGLMYRRDVLHSFVDTATGETFDGIIRGISSTACLLVEIPGGSVREFAFNDITYLIAGKNT